MMPECPECERLAVVAPKSQAIGNFLDWLRERGVYLSTEHEHGDGCYNGGDRVCGASKGELVPYLRDIEQLLAEFFDIDLKKVDRERSALLDAIRATATATTDTEVKS